MRDQATRIGPATLTRYAEVVQAGLGEMRGATAPRLLLEVVCARLLLPSASDTESALLQRVERIETRLDMSIPAGSTPAEPVEQPVRFTRPSAAPKPASKPEPAAAKPEHEPEPQPEARPEPRAKPTPEPKPAPEPRGPPKPRPRQGNSMPPRCEACGRRCATRSVSAAAPPR